MTDKRPDWDHYFSELAKTISTRANCFRASCGAVIVSSNKLIIGHGYNGAPPTQPSCFDEGHCKVVKGSDNRDHCVRTSHAEINALHNLYSLNLQKQLPGATLYVTGHPCENCLKEVLKHGIKRIVISDTTPYNNFDDKIAKDLLEAFGATIHSLELK